MTEFTKERVQTHAKDDRRNQRYFRKVELSLAVALDDVTVERTHTTNYDTAKKYLGVDISGRTKDSLIASRIKADLEEYADEIGGKVSMRCKHTNNFADQYEDGALYLDFEWIINAEKPSKIMDEEEAIDTFCDEHRVAAIKRKIAELVTAAAEWLTEQDNKIDRLVTVERLGEHVASVAAEKAKDAVNFDARLEALKAEFEARAAALRSEVKGEALKQGAEYVEGSLADDCKDTEWIDDQDVANASKFWQRFIQEPETGSPGMIFAAPKREKVVHVTSEDLGFDSE